MKVYLLIATLIVSNNTYTMEKKTTTKSIAKPTNLNNVKQVVSSLQKENSQDKTAVLDNILNHSGIRPNPVSANYKETNNSSLFVVEKRSKL